MAGLFKRLRGNLKYQDGAKPKIILREYPPKIILAWAKGAEGHSELLDYLFNNGYKELTMTIHAYYHKPEAIDWLMQNGFPHLLALVNASEGNEEASEWLQKNNFLLLHNIALAISGEKEGFEWLKQNSTQEFYYLTLNLKTLKEK
ncbi:MAG: hypothetical protein H3C31_06505 [Brumimicrobium sp.]|nr:hypothetical protein [Brumimicrobium sp.]